MADLDNDGDLDLLVGSDRNSAMVVQLINDNLLVETAAGASYNYVEDLTNAFASGVTNTKGVAAADLDGDGDIDLVVANDGTNQVFFNVDGRGTYVLDANSAIAGGSVHSKDVDIADLDGDGTVSVNGPSPPNTSS